MASPIRASSSSSSSRKRPRNHVVFLSFRGEDTRMGFTGHLYDALTRQGIDTFRDDPDLRAGDQIRPELLEAIAASKFAVVVLSSGYATSAWCLEEVTHIVDCMEKMELVVIPVFYHVHPSDVRHQRNSFHQAFAKHETSHRFAPAKVETWRAALTKVGDMKGVHVRGTRYESEVITEIVRRVFMDLQDTLPRDATKGLVGIESRVKELKSLLNMESNDIRFIGICGMSGMGKTTLAEVVYEEIRAQFQGCSFIENIKDVSKKNDEDLCKLQQKLLVEILKDEHVRVRSVIEGFSMLRERLCGLKIIIVLDDVNHCDQLKFLVGEREWFGRGSRIIITTTNEDLLTVHKVDGKYKCEGLNFSDATKLFNLSAFTEGLPKLGFEKLSSGIVKLAGGLPLALNAFGSLLFGKGEEYWRDTLQKLQQCPEKEVLQRLEICYGRLDRNEQDIFIYVACFLKGRDQALVNDILKNIGLYPVRGMDILINRSLIIINYDETVWMHDLLQQMGWEILRKEFPRKPRKRTGLNYRQDIVDICTSKEKGTKAIEIINQEHYGVEVENCIGDPESFSKMKKLKFLRISNILFPSGIEYLSNDLRVIEWYGCSLKSLPTTFEPKQIYELDMRSSRLEKLWQKYIDLPNLRSIDLGFSKDLTELPDLTSTPKLEILNLEGCTNLVELHKSLLVHKRLLYMNLKGCVHLQSLGSNIEMEALESLILSGCSKLEYIPEFGENMKSLEHLYLDGTKIKRLPESLGKMHSLRKLDVSETTVEELPSFILHLQKLRLLHIRGCCLLSLTKTFHSVELPLLGLKELVLSACNLSAIPDGIGLLYGLKELDLSGNDFVTLPARISLLSNLRMLCLNDCKRLESLPMLSKINEDSLDGLEIRFSHYISGEELDISKFHVSNHSSNPTVSCLNCPKLIESQQGNGLADTVLIKYLQVRTECRVIPEAIFEIVAAGSEIPQWWFEVGRTASVIFKDVKYRRDSFYVNFHECIGVAICAVIVVPRSLVNMRGTYMEVKYEIVAHIHVEGKNWRIPVPINFLEAKLETQLVWYWTVTDDLRRALDPFQRHQFHVSFSVEPEANGEDVYLEVKKFGVRFLRRKDILELRGTRFRNTGIPRIVDYAPSLAVDLRRYQGACEADQELQSFNLNFQNHTCKVISTLVIGFKHGSISLDSLREVIESILEMNQEVVKVILECKQEIRQEAQLFCLVNYFFESNLPILQLCTDFMKFLKRTGDSWLVVQAAMLQIEAKRRAGSVLQQLIDPEAEKVPLSADFIRLFLSYADGQITMLRDHICPIMRNMQPTSVKAWRKVFYATTAATLSKVLVSAALAFRIAEPLPMRTTTDSVHGIRTWIDESELYSSLARYQQNYGGREESFGNYNGRKESSGKVEIICLAEKLVGRDFAWDLRISDFDGILKLLEELKRKMDWVLQLPSFVTKEDEEMIVISMDEIKKKISGCTKTIEDMSGHAFKCVSDIRRASTEALQSNHKVDATE